MPDIALPEPRPSVIVEILRTEARRSEVIIGWTRLLLAVCDLALVGLSQFTTAAMPRLLIGVDAGYFVFAAAVLVFLRRRTWHSSVPFLVTLADFAYTALYLRIYGHGLHPDMVAGASMVFGVLYCLLSGLRFNAVATAWAGVLGAVVAGAGSALAGSSPALAATAVASILFAAGISSYVSRRHRATLGTLAERRKFERLLPREVVDALVRGDQDIALGGREAVVSVLFADIRGFTGLCERMAPVEVLALLNDYYSAIVAVVFRHFGVVDKFIGDAVMAIFGAPIGRPDDAARAVRCALDICRVVGALNAERRGKNLATIEVGVGIHTGPVVAGTVGSADLMEYTVIGDTVNVAARIESLTRQFQVPILVSRSTADAAGKTFDLRPVGTVPVKGRAEPTEVLAVTAER